jgi:glycosyltransferase involved in cell wall biosynthesis
MKSIDVLVVSFSPISSDPRVLRQIQALSTRPWVNLSVAGFGVFSKPGIFYTQLVRRQRTTAEKITGLNCLIFGLFEEFAKRCVPWGRQLEHLVKQERYDLIIANDPEVLPHLAEASGHPPIVADLHEYSLDLQTDSSLIGSTYQRYLQWTAYEFVKDCASTMTVTDEIARAYSEKLDICRPQVIPNVPQRRILPTIRTNPNEIRLVHHGVVAPSRGIDKLIQAVNMLPSKYTLDLYLQADKKQIQGLNKYVGKSTRIRFQRPVPTESIPLMLNGYDVSVFAAQPTSLSDSLALPNKLFEAIQGRNAQVVTPISAMSHFIAKNQLGVVSKGFSSTELAETILALDAPQIDEFKRNANQAAAKFCWESYEGFFFQVLDQCFSVPK